MKLSELWQRWFPREANPANTDDDADDATDDADDPFSEPVVLEIRDVIDLHAIPPRQIKAVVEEYLVQAHTRGFRVVRLIHGKGIGVQREAVRAILSGTPFVSSFADAPPEAGGWGATIAELLPGKSSTEKQSFDERNPM